MPTLNTLGDRFEAKQTFKGQTIVVSVHLEAKTAYLATVLKRGGADVIVLVLIHCLRKTMLPLAL